MSTYTTPRQRPSVRNLTLSSSAGNTPTMGPGDIEVGDTVDVPGGMDGTVRFVGEVRGKKGYFVGVELSEQYASRGKNSGDAEGVRYFSTSIPGAGIFLPLARAIKKELHSPTGSVPPTPTTPGYSSARTDASPTPAMPSLAKSLLGRAQSPALRPNSRPSLPRPESPTRRSNAMAAPPRPPSASARPSLTMNSQNRSVTGPRFTASPAPGRSITKTPSKTALTSKTFRAPSRSGDNDGEEVAQLKALLHEKNEKIKQLTLDFDNHRADFRNTLDALEMASTETQRVYEAKVAELEAQNEAMARERNDFAGEQGDFEMVAKQLRDVEIVVQELEDGLEDARRGEAEARGEVEFLRGEVERLRAELRWEREQGEKALELREREWRSSKSRSGLNGIGGRRESSGFKSPEQVSKAAPEPEDQTTPPATANAGGAAAVAAAAATTSPTTFFHDDDDFNERPVTAYGPSSEGPSFSGIKADPSTTVAAAAAAATTTAAAAAAKKPAVKDEDKWCAMCEQDGHDVTNCPAENMI